MAGLILLACALSIALAVLAAVHRHQRRRIRQLENRLEAFLDHGGPPEDLALGEDPLSRLQDTVGELQNRLLRAGELQAEEVHRTSVLTADISHQLKTPLTTLRLYTEMDAPAHLESSLVQIGRMEHLIQSLLRLERLCADGYRFTFAPCDIRELVQEQWRFLSFPNRSLTVAGNACFRCDRKWLGEAFLNLLKNACEHTAPGGTIAVAMEQTERAFFCTVWDDGGGVPDFELPRLFDRFYRSESAKGSGAGLGLAIVQEIIRRHHGTILAANSGKGLKMEITLPVWEETLTKT